MEDYVVNNSRISIANYHYTPIKITGYSIKENKDSLIVLTPQFLLINTSIKERIKKEISIKGKVKNLYFKTKNNELIRKKKW